MSIRQGERYHGERMVVNGELIDHYAYEFGDDSLEVAKQYDAEQFDALLEARMQHWIEHHDKVLGNTLNVLERENAELRERCRYLKKGDILHVLTDQEYIDQCERERLMQVSIDALDGENAKLRELVRAAWKCIHSGLSCSDCRMVAGGCTLKSAMRKLGIEVGE